MPILSIFLNIMGSRIAQIVLAFFAGFFYAWVTTNNKWEIKVTAERAAAQALLKSEIAKEKQALINIAKDATIRAEQDAKEMDDLQKIIDEFDKKERVIVKTEKGKCSPCIVDRSFIDVVQRVKSRRP